METHGSITDNPTRCYPMSDDLNFAMQCDKVVTVIFILLFCFIPFPALAKSPNVLSTSTMDLRILIDVSPGTKNADPNVDPGQLLNTSIKLMSELIQPGIYAGIWSFAADTQVLIPHQIVDEAWKRRAENLSINIGLNSVYTNIENALDTLNNNWQSPSFKKNRIIILLSDGDVNVGINPDDNALSKKRIYEVILPRLQKQKVTLHSIALSGMANIELLKTLSLETGGIYQQAENAEALKRIFFMMFEMASNHSALPIQNGLFTVDDSIQDITLMIYNKNSQQELKIDTPNGRGYTYSTHPEEVSWYYENQLNIITIKKPAPGIWHINSENETDHQVVAVTNAALSINALPSHVLPGEKIRVSARLTRNNLPLMVTAMLERVKFTLKVTHKRDKKITIELPLFDNGENADLHSADGEFSNSIIVPQLTGPLSVAILAQTPTFERVARVAMEILPPLLKSHVEWQDKELVITLKPVLRFSKLNLEKIALLEDDAITEEEVALGEQWQFVRESLPQHHKMQAQLKGKLNGRPFIYQQTISLPALTNHLPELAIVIEEEVIHWMKVAELVALFNLLVAIVAAVIWYFLRESSPPKNPELGAVL